MFKLDLEKGEEPETKLPTSAGSEKKRIPDELFQTLKGDAVKVLHSIFQQIWKTQVVATGLEKVSFHFHSNPKEGQCQIMFKLRYNCTHFTC